MDGEVSSWVPVTSGVPQGTVIGPILFLVYINDLPAKLQSKVQLFADDTIVYMAVTNKTDAAILQKDLKLLEESEKSQMSFNPDKCNVLQVTRCRNRLTYDYILHNRILKEKDAVKYLGVTVHHKLSWNKHICSIVKKVNSSIGFLRRNLQIYQKHIKANDRKSSRHLLYGILSPKRTKIKLRWYREELPALFATTTDAKQVSLPYLMSSAGAVSGSEEQTED